MSYSSGICLNLIKEELKAAFLKKKRREKGLAYHMRIEEADFIHFLYQL